MGGLGNQLFQYATADALAKRHQVELKLDLSFLKTDSQGQHTQRDFELNAFRISAEIASDQEVRQYTQPNRVQTILSKIGLRKKSLVKEKSFEFAPESKGWPSDCYLDGFWQSEKYFRENRKEILAKVSLKHHLPDECQAFAELIKNTVSVSLHIRRGDYAKLTSANLFHGLLPISYYIKALDYLNSKLQNYTVFVFSDDLEWARANLKLQQPTVYVDYQTQNKTASDLMLMSWCKHNVIANSSYSWWGAWLNQHEGKQVVAPSPWFRKNDINTKDLLPDNWKKIEVNYEHHD